MSGKINQNNHGVKEQPKRQSGKDGYYREQPKGSKERMGLKIIGVIRECGLKDFILRVVAQKSSTRQQYPKVDIAPRYRYFAMGAFIVK